MMPTPLAGEWFAPLSYPDGLGDAGMRVRLMSGAELDELNRRQRFGIGTGFDGSSGSGEVTELHADVAERIRRSDETERHLKAVTRGMKAAEQERRAVWAARLIAGHADGTLVGDQSGENPQLLQQAHKRTIVDAYDGLIARRISIDTFYVRVLDFATRKMRSAFSKVNVQNGLHFDFTMADTPDDAAMDIVLQVMRDLMTTIQPGRTGEDFHAWLNKVCFNKGTDYARAFNRQRQQRVSLDGPDNEDGEPTENLEIYHNRAPVPEREFIGGVVPESFTPAERLIVESLQSTGDFDATARDLDYEPGRAFRKRIQRLKEKAAPSNAARHERLAEQVETVRRQQLEHLAARRGGERAHAVETEEREAA
jgi:hypothetical protein